MSANRFTLESNILVYTVDTRDPLKQKLAIQIVQAAARVTCPLAMQALGEFFVAATRKVKLPPSLVQPHMAELLRTFETFSYSAEHILVASQESSLGRFQFWDAVLLASAAEAGCTICLSEDMANGPKLGPISVHNPFGDNNLTEAAREVLGLK
jgi:predicted nucleic acid-binding protein